MTCDFVLWDRGWGGWKMILSRPDELDRFERTLRDEWEREFDLMMAGLPEDADEETKRLAGLELLHERLNQVRVRIRQRYEEPFFGRTQPHLPHR